MFCCKSGGRFTNPRTVVVRRVARCKPLTITRAIALHHAPKLIPVNRPLFPVPGSLVEFEMRVWQRQPNRLRLCDSHVHETLAQLVVAFSLDAPARKFTAVRRVLVVRTEHHERRPPP